MSSSNNQKNGGNVDDWEDRSAEAEEPDAFDLIEIDTYRQEALALLLKHRMDKETLIEAVSITFGRDVSDEVVDLKGKPKEDSDRLNCRLLLLFAETNTDEVDAVATPEAYTIVRALLDSFLCLDQLYQRLLGYLRGTCANRDESFPVDEVAEHIFYAGLIAVIDASKEDGTLFDSLDSFERLLYKFAVSTIDRQADLSE
jgi:hypothetical protein